MPLNRQKTLMFWSMHQVVVALICVGIYLTWLATGGRPLSILTVILGAIVFLDLLVIHGMSVWQVIGLRMGLLLRQASGRSEGSRSPLAAGADVGVIRLPSGKQLLIRQMAGNGFDGSAFLWDAQARTATAVIESRSDPATFSDADSVNRRALSFGSAISGLRDMPDVKRIVIQSRTILSPAGGADGEQGASLATHDQLIAIVTQPQEGARTVRAVSRMLGKAMNLLADSLVAAGARGHGNMTALDAQQIRGAMKALTDPDASALLGQSGRLPDDVPVSTSFAEYADHVEVGSMDARTFWVDHYPEERPMEAGGLEPLLEESSFDQVVTQVFKFETENRAKKTLGNQQIEAERVQRLNTRLGRPEDRRDDEELRNIAESLEELAQERGAAQMQMFITVIATTKGGLEKATDGLMGEVSGLMHLDPQRDMQLARWEGVQPLGLEGSDLR